MSLWLVPTVYVVVSIACGLVLPRIEQAYFSSHTFDLSVASAQAYLAAIASGMMSLTGVVFAMAFVTIQFSAIAYSPRLVRWFARDRFLFHALGAFAATFVYALATLAWVDRGGSGSLPLFSGVLVTLMLTVSMLLFSRLVQRVTDLQVTNVLQLMGDSGREVIRDTIRALDRCPADERKAATDARENVLHGTTLETLEYSGYPRVIVKLEVDTLVARAKQRDQAIEMIAAVGDTLVDGSVVLQVHAAGKPNSIRDLMDAVKLGMERTVEQDPKFPIRVLVDIAIKALSHAINDPTTAVQAIDQIEDLLRRIGRHNLQQGTFADAEGVVRLVVPMPTWEDYLSLAFDEIRQYGANSLQVMRRLRAALTGLRTVVLPAHAEAVTRYLGHLDLVIERSELDVEDRMAARQADQQGLGLSRRRQTSSAIATGQT